ncbi:putative signaling protein [Rhodocyclaceae bacterium]|nr:putative signaling protein [Rhodocyclaceae bacterium]
MSYLPRRLYVRLVLLGAIAIAASVGFFSLYITHEQGEFAAAAMERDAVTLATSLADGSMAGVRAGDYDGVARGFQQAAHRDAILSLVLTTPDGRVIRAVRRDRPGAPLATTDTGRETLPGSAEHGVRIGAGSVVAWHPVGDDSVVGWVKAELSMAEYDAVRAHVWRDTFIAALLAVAGSALLFLALLRHPVRDIERAAAFAARLDEDRGARLEVTTTAEEVAQLVNSLDHASVSLRLQEELHAREQAILEVRNRIFQLMATGGDLREILALIIRSIEMERADMIGSILQVDATGKVLVNGVAPGLPAEYNAAVEGLPIGDGIGSCGTAAHRGERVVVEDIACHPFWAPFREKAAQAGVAACWSEPIRSSKGKVIGTFALYHRTPRVPTPADIELISHAAHFAAIAIERRHIEEELQLASSVYQASGEAMFVTDEKNRIVAVNPAFTTLTGYAPHEVIGQDPKILGSGRNDKTVYLSMWHALEATGQWQGEIWNRRKNGSEYAEWLTITTVRNAEGGLHRRIALFSDITERKQADEIIWQQANYDTLTGLPNRRLFRDRLRQELRRAERNRGSLALLFIDLDRFKEVNDALGHDAGDQLLVEASRRIVACVRETDTVARLGGDEFTVTLPAMEDPGAVERIAQTIVQSLSEPFTLGRETVYVSGSIGITEYPVDAEDLETLLKHADQAMYAAKEAGRNGYSWFTPSMQYAAQVRRGLVHDLRGALAAGQFEVYYQPIVELPSRRIVKAEALLRWRHPERGMVSPEVFIPLAEEVGLINEIGEWVFHQVAAQARRWRASGLHDLPISVNKSPRQFATVSDGQDWLDHLKGIELPPVGLIVEITEGLLLDERPEVAERLRSFRAAGIQIAIDDFGTGYSALSYLQKFDIDIVKIDKSFVQHLATDSRDRALAEAIVAMAHKLGLKVVAEGVETEQQQEHLVAAGCDYAQGYLYARPMPAADFERMLRSAGQMAAAA